MGRGGACSRRSVEVRWNEEGARLQPERASKCEATEVPRRQESPLNLIGFYTATKAGSARGAACPLLPATREE